MRFNLSNNLTFHQSKTVPDQYDELWNATRSYDVLSVWKDSKYLEWRYDQNPNNEFDYFYLVENGKIIALSVVMAKAGGDVSICELLVKDKNVLNGRMLINRILSYYTRGRYTKVFFIGSDPGFFNEVFTAFRSEIWFGVVLCGRVFTNSFLKEDFDQPSYWTLTYGDMDLV